MKNQTTVATVPTQSELLKAKNEAVKSAYFNILSEVKSLIKHYPSDYFRTYLEVDYSEMGFTNQHGFYSPLIHLRFEESNGKCSIYFAKNFNVKQQIGYYLDTLLSRCVYNMTASTATPINIEDCLNVSLFRIETFHDAKLLLDQEFKGCVKVTVEALKKEA
jgi:hypothetical protein